MNGTIIRITPSTAARRAMEMPALTGAPVTQWHTDYCARTRHAVHTVEGVQQPTCPRCGERTAQARAFAGLPLHLRTNADGTGWELDADEYNRADERESYIVDAYSIDGTPGSEHMADVAREWPAPTFAQIVEMVTAHAKTLGL